MDKTILIIVFRKTMSLIHISNPALQNELLGLFSAIVKEINYYLIEKDCEQHALMLSEKTQAKFNKIAAVRMIGFICEVFENSCFLRKFMKITENQTEFFERFKRQNTSAVPRSRQGNTTRDRPGSPADPLQEREARNPRIFSFGQSFY